MSELKQLKDKISMYIDQCNLDLLELSAQIHSHPELCYQEVQAVDFMKAMLNKYGYDVQESYGDIPTSFRADSKNKKSGPTVAIMAEYDALKDIGHGCGHNIIATCAVGAFLGLSSVIEELEGNVCIIGTPAEEGGAGKVKLLRAGAFDDVDFALMMHPSGANGNLSGRGGRAATNVNITFYGKGTHSSAPQNGINALNAVISVFNQIDMMRPTFDVQDNINGIITKGGIIPNGIPELGECKFSIRAATMKRIEELVAFVEMCVENAERLTGAKAEIIKGEISAERYPNMPMCECFKNNMETLGVMMHWADPNKLYGSSDVGNVSIKLPAIHEYLSITDDASVQAHTSAYTEVSKSERANEVCILGAKGLAMTACEILFSKEFQVEIKQHHKEQVPAFYTK